jgi:hypothetical protein
LQSTALDVVLVILALRDGGTVGGAGSTLRHFRNLLGYQNFDQSSGHSEVVDCVSSKKNFQVATKDHRNLGLSWPPEHPHRYQIFQRGKRVG